MSLIQGRIDNFFDRNAGFFFFSLGFLFLIFKKKFKTVQINCNIYLFRFFLGINLRMFYLKKKNIFEDNVRMIFFKGKKK